MKRTYSKSIVTNNTLISELAHTSGNAASSQKPVELLRYIIRIRRKKLTTHIHSMPPEILSDIMYLYASTTYSLFDLAWTNLLLMCRRWREVGLRTPSLWSCMDFSQLRPDSTRLGLQIRRSAGAPVDIRAHSCPSVTTLRAAWTSYFSIAPLDPYRLRSLNIHGTRKVVDVLLRILKPRGSTCPLLAEIKVHIIRQKNDEERRLPVVNKLISGASRLRVLEFHNLEADWKHISRLKELKLHGTCVQHTELPAALDALSRCPELEVLVLSVSKLPKDDTSPLARPVAVRLSCLTQVRLGGDTSACADFLAALALPPTASIEFLEPIIAQRLWSSRICAYIHAHFHSAGARPLRTLSINNEVLSHCLTLSLSPHTTTRPITDPLGEYAHDAPCLYLRVKGASPSETRRAVADVLRALPAHAITHVRGGACWPLQSADWAMLFAHLPGLATVTVHADASALLLVVALDGLLRTARRRPVAHLRLECAFLFARCGRPAEPAQRREGAQRAFRKLLKYAARAKAAGVPLETVELVGDGQYDVASRLLGRRTHRGVCRLLAHGFVCNEVLLDEESAPREWRGRQRYISMRTKLRQMWSTSKGLGR